MITIKMTDDKTIIDTIIPKLKANHGYCPCVPPFAWNKDTKCMCKEFLSMPVDSSGHCTCHCGLYYKVVE